MAKAKEAEEKKSTAKKTTAKKTTAKKATTAKKTTAKKADDSKGKAKAAPKKARTTTAKAESTPAPEVKKEEKAPAKTTTKAAAPKPKKREEIKPLENFDWESLDESGFAETYDKAEKEKYEKQYEETLVQVNEKEVVNGTVVGLTDKDVIVNIGFKSDGLVPVAEFRDLGPLKVGDKVEVYIELQEDANGQLALSRRKAKIVQAWDNIQKALDKDEIIDGLVKRRTKGGLIVDVFGVEAFLPGSQIDVKPIRDFDVFVGKKMQVKVVKINYSNDNVVVSHKVLIEKDLEKQRQAILNNLEKGQVLEGTIKNMTNFGVFIDLGGVDGLLHITDISWGRINHPEEVLKLDEKVNVVVLDFDDDKKRISLGMKQLTKHPWDSLDQKVEIGSKVKGKIVNVADYGAFLELQPGIEGLIHVSEMSWSQHLRNPSDFLSVGDEVEAVVLTLDRDERKMSLGIKQLTQDPWTRQDVLDKYAIGSKHKGIVRNLTNFGLFLELEEGIDGLVHVSDLSWTKKIKHPSEFVKVGDELEVMVMEMDADNRRLALSHKHLEENPWDTFEETFEIGSKHKCNITVINERGAILELPYGLEGFALKKNIVKEDDSMPEVGESLDFIVTEFSKDDKKINLSHVKTYKEVDDEPEVKKKPAAKRGKKSNKAINKINQGVEKDTLGDLAALSALKEQMDDDSAQEEVKEKKKPAKKATAKKAEAKVEEKDEKEEKEEKKTAKKAAAKKTTTAKKKSTTKKADKKEDK